METFIGIIVILAIAVLLIKKYKPSWYELAKTYITNTIKGNKKTDIEGTEIEASFQVRKLLLVESVLHPEGPEYSIMQTKHLF